MNLAIGIAAAVVYLGLAVWLGRRLKRTAKLLPVVEVVRDERLDIETAWKRR